MKDRIAHPEQVAGKINLASRSFAALALCACALTFIFPRAHAATTFTNLTAVGGSIGNFVQGNLIQGTDGNFYGTTGKYGSGGDGAVFRMSPDGLLTNLSAFGDSNGVQPGALMQASDGNFYGASGGGTTNQGTGNIFRLSPSGVRTTLFTFRGTNGSGPKCLVQGTDGNFYGVTVFGGIGYITNNNSGLGFGTVFKLTTNGVLTTLVWFNGTNGANPEFPPIQAADGNFYGTTDAGGADTNLNHTVLGFYLVGQGTIYKMTPDGTFTSLASFNTNNGGGNVSQLIQTPDGSFYGTTFHGGTSNSGTLFKLDTNQTLTTLASFDPAVGGYPSYFTRASDGNFYAICRTGVGPPYGLIFKGTLGGAVTVAFSFADQTGTFPYVLMQSSNGNFYGASQTSYMTSSEHLFRLSLPLSPVSQAPAQSVGKFNTTWSAVAGQNYQIQYRSNLTQTNWNNLGPSFTATNGTISLSDDIGPDSQRVYRLVVLP